MTHSGILNVNKPAGMTSRDAVDRVERLVRPARAGHAGTLDPLATGVLVICVGQATRLIQYIQRMPKSYRATFLLGQTSDTDDIEGHVVPVEGAAEPEREAIDRVLAKFVGTIEQRPPAHSAVKLAGRRAYHLARQGEEVELRPREVAIHTIAVRRFAFPELEVDVECGSGTYIRALARDVGAALGTGAVMSALERTAIGLFCVEDAVAVNDLEAATLGQHLQPPLNAVVGLPRVTLTEAQLIEIRNGRPILSSWLRDICDAPAAADVVAVDSAGRLAAVLFQKRAGELWPRLNFSESTGALS
jgi:tRNA pseudouridine55 synthase